MEKFTNIDDCIKFFTNKNFKIARDTQDDTLRTISLRAYDEGNFCEATIKQKGSDITVKQTYNGKPI